MTPNPHPTLLERADEMEVASHKEFAKQDLVFAKQLADYAHNLRMQHEQDQKNEANRQRP